MIHTSVPPSHSSRVRLHFTFFLPPSSSTTRFELPFVILALVVHPSSPLPPVPLRTPTVLSLHCLLRVLGACAFTLLLLICAPHAPLFRPPIPTPPSSFPLFPLPPPTPPLPPSPPPATSAAPQHQHRDAAHEGALEAQEQHYEDYDARFALKHHCTNTVLSRRLRCSRVEVGSCFVGSAERPFPRVGGADTEVVRHDPALACGCADVAPAFFRSTRCAGVPSGLCVLALRDSCSMLRVLMCSSQMSAISLEFRSCCEKAEEWHFGCLAFSRDIHSRFREPSFLHPHPCTLHTPHISPSLSVAHWMDVGRMSWCIHRRTTELAFHFALNYYCLYFPADYINTVSIPPCTTRVILGWSWLLVAVLELFIVVGMWLCLRRLFLLLLLIAVIFCWDVLRIRPPVLVTPSLIVDLPPRVPRRLFFCHDQMIFVTGHFFLLQQLLRPTISTRANYRFSPSTEMSASPPDSAPFPPADHSDPAAVHCPPHLRSSKL
ncbi:hypothetical protein B0H13DRAFT_2678127 [Mycena leptocephala]|nr:hypothetical protein B0H13DRAFT_2678127 [Mycena leptocephala]